MVLKLHRWVNVFVSTLNDQIICTIIKLTTAVESWWKPIQHMTGTVRLSADHFVFSNTPPPKQDFKVRSPLSSFPELKKNESKIYSRR